MKIDTSECRLYFNGTECFFDISSIKVYEPYSLKINIWPNFQFTAIVEMPQIENHPIETTLVSFPDKNWFDEWYKSLKKKPVILWSRGKPGANP